MEERVSLETTGEAAFASDAHGRIVGWNAAAERLLGYERERVLGHPCHEILGGRDVFGNRYCRERCNVQEMIRCREPVRSFDVDVRKRSGEFVRAQLSVVVIPGREPDAYTVVHLLDPRRRGNAGNHFLERMRTGARASAEEKRGAGAAAPAGASLLTARETEVLRLLAGGSATPEIAQALGISIHTVRTHTRNILRKLEVHSTIQAVSVALQKRLI